jgi:hypothetical protein
MVIGEGAFYSCPNLSEAYIPNSLIAIGDKAYANNPLLTEFDLAESHMFFLLYDGGLYTYDSIDPSSDYNLIAYPAGRVDSNVDIHTNTSLVSTNVFEGASHIQTVTMPNSLIGDFGLIFKETTGLQNIILISNTRPQVLDEIDGVLYSSDFTVLYKYPEAKTNTSYTVNSSTITINDAAFYGASNLTTVILPEGLVNIDSEAFMNTENIATINIPTTLKNIRDMAFYNSNSITSIVLTNTVESVDYMAFAEMDSLTSIRFEGVGYVDGYVLYNCGSLTDLFLNAVTFYPDALNGIRNLQNFELVSGTLYAGIEDDVIYAKDMITLYRYGDWLTSTSFTTPDNITMLGGNSFGTNEYLTSLTLSSNVENIFQTSLSQLPNLEELIILRESSLSIYNLSEILNHDLQHVTIYVTASSYDDYINDPNNSEFIDQIVVIPS